MGFSFENMTHHTQLEDKLGENDKFWEWKYKISLILEENDLDQFINMEVLEPEGDEESLHIPLRIISSLMSHP